MINDLKENKTASGTILVAEDGDLDTLVFRKAFARAELPHTLRFVSNGQQAIDYLEGKAPYSDREHFPKPDLIVLDLSMPDVDGFYVLRWVRAPGRERTPVVVLASSDVDADKRFALTLGAQEYRTKSPGIAALSQFLKDACERWLQPAENPKPASEDLQPPEL
jgi:two-component system response regulator